MILYLIPARGGSKRLPGKNLRKLAGIPLVAWAIRRAQGAARMVGGESRIVVSTDSEEIAAVSREWGAEVVIRPGHLADCHATSRDVARHALEAYPDCDEILLTQATSPLATAEDLARTYRVFRRQGPAATCRGGEPSPNGAAYATIRPPHHKHWDLPFRLAWPEQDGFPVEMAPSRSIDIDTEDDWHMAEALLAARPVAPFGIAGREIGPGHPCFVIAEAGINHGGDWNAACDLIEAAADAGVDAVKFQTFVPEKLAEPGPHRDMLSRLTLRSDDYAEFKARAESRGLIFLSSVFDESSVDLLDSIGVPAFKIPSGEIINLPLLRHVASKGKPVILSTGMSTMREVAAAVDALAGVPLALLHCVSEYPTQSSRMNLRAMETMREAFGLPVGWSDHVVGVGGVWTAVSRGASIVEKHIKLDGYEGPDSEVSSEPGEFGTMVSILHGLGDSLGTGEKVPTEGELETAKVARRRDGLRRNAG
jgi:N,N'-diacetyllegionaminate synthase